MFVDHIPRQHHISTRLGHFLSISIQDQAKANHVLETIGIKQKCANGMQRIEPTAGLIHCLANVIRRKVLLEFLLVLKGIMPLAKRH